MLPDSSQTRTADQGSRRRGPLTSSAKSVLARRLSDPDRPFSFPCETDSSRPIPRVNNAHDRAVRDSKVAPFRLYDVRHTEATRAAESAIDLVTVAALLGHSKIQIVLRYTHPTQEHQTRAVERMEQFAEARRLDSALAVEGRGAGLFQ